MKKLSIATVLAIGLATPLAATADDDVTIRVMEMHEISSDAVMQHIELPDSASDRAAENGQPGHRERERLREHTGEGDGIMAQDGEMEQYREMEQMRERMMDEQHEHAQQTEEVDTTDTMNTDGMHSGMGGRQ